MHANLRRHSGRNPAVWGTVRAKGGVWGTVRAKGGRIAKGRGQVGKSEPVGDGNDIVCGWRRRGPNARPRCLRLKLAAMCAKRDD